MITHIEITGFYAALLTLLFILLSFNVIRLRIKHKVGIGSGDVRELDKAIRIHGNFAEYMPMALILLAFVEMQGISTTWLHILGATLVIGRVAHFAGLSKSIGTSLPRFIGTLSTFISLLAMAIILLVQFAS